jgi:hypothetical protein
MTDIILFDIVGYSLLSDDDQYNTMYLINQELETFSRILYGQSFRRTEEVVLGIAPTGDGAYIILDDSVAGYGLFMAISLRTALLQLKHQAGNLFPGLRTAIHFGAAIPIKDLTGNKNFVGSGLNDCARLLSVDRRMIANQHHITDENYIVVSSSAFHQFEESYSGKEIAEFLKMIKFEIGDEVVIEDKHKKQHEAYFVESSRYAAITPPKPKHIVERINDLN